MEIEKSERRSEARDMEKNFDAFDAQFESLRQVMELNGKFDSKRAESLLRDLKFKLLSIPLNKRQEDTSITLERRIKFRDILEFDALYSIRTKNLEEFERVMSQLKCYYFRPSDLPISTRMPLLISIHLVHTLALKRLVDFNIELQLAREAIGPNEFLDYASDLHQSVIENSSSRLFKLENKPPSQDFNQFTADLLNGARNNHADSIQKAYNTLTISELATILNFQTKDEARLFIQKREWEISEDGETICFNHRNGGNKSIEPKDMLSRSVDLSLNISLLA